MQNVYIKIVQGLRDYFGENGFKKAVIGLSGGIDSALTLKLAVDALKAENVTAIHMPDLGVTDRINSEHAQTLAEYLGVHFEKVVINRFITEFENLPWERTRTAMINVKARVRSVILYDYANSSGALVLGTSNKSEIKLGYGTKYGDLAADIEVIGDLYKTQVYRLADFLKLPIELIEKAPSAELFKGQTDASELGADYEVLDQILIAREKNYPVDAFDHNLVRDLKKRIKTNKHKTKMPVVLLI